MVFDCTEPKEIFPFAWPKIYMMTNAATGAPQADCYRRGRIAPRCNLYSPCRIVCGQNTNWAKCLKSTDPQTKAAALRNPFWKPKPDDFSAPGIGVVQLGIPQLQTEGIMFCACGMAITVYSAVVAGNTKQDPATVKKEWLDNLIAGYSGYAFRCLGCGSGTGTRMWLL